MRKTLSFACLHFSVAFSLGWLMTGSWRVGGALALVEPLCNTVVFHLHEKFWQARSGQPVLQQPPAPDPCGGCRTCMPEPRTQACLR
jgi:Predicted membrane protein